MTIPGLRTLRPKIYKLPGTVNKTIKKQLEALITQTVYCVRKIVKASKIHLIYGTFKETETCNFGG